MSNTISLRSTPGFYERLVLDMFSKMTLGRLYLSLPSGEQFNIGKGEGGISATLEIKNPSFFKKVILFGDIGFGESYVDGDWDSEDVTALIKWFLLNIDNVPTISGSPAKNIGINVLKYFNKLSHFKRKNDATGSRKNISAHYDLSNEFFSLFLDQGLTYSSAYFENDNMALASAQVAKYDRLCRQLNLQNNDHVLEIGSGWGANAVYIARNYGCKVTTATISEEQFNHTKDLIEREGLCGRIEVQLCDYRSLTGEYDKIVSIEMLEAVGADYYETFFKKCDCLLKKQGIMALQVITCPDSRFEKLQKGVDWIQKHIFPGSLLPSVGAINRAINAVSELSLVDLKDLGAHYAKTLEVWQETFNKNSEKIKALGFDDNFMRKWKYYLCYCQGAFEMRNISVMQFTYSRPNNTSR